MLKKLLAVLAMTWAACAFAGVDVNKATPAELDGVKGIGPALSTRIMDERKKSPFKDWADLTDRVKGLGDKNAVRLSDAGLTVNGEPFKGAAPAAVKPGSDSKATKEVKAAADSKPATKQ